VTLHNRPVARIARGSQRLEIGPAVAAVLRPEETTRLHDLMAIDRLRCVSCGGWIDPDSDAPASVSIVHDDDRVVVEFAHGECSSSRADLAPLVVLAGAEPLGIEYAQAVHPDAGPVLLWERKLDLRVRRLDGHEASLYLDADRWEGFHPALADEPVRLLAGWLLRADGEDLALHHGGVEAERFHGAIERAPAGWLQSLGESGFCLLIVGAGVGLERPAAAAIQRAIREDRALIGLAEVEI
jgi:hypothetical protein